MITTVGFKYEKIRFPKGEIHTKITEVLSYSDYRIDFEYENDQEIIELLMLCDSLKRKGKKLHHLYIPYIPFSRQDRINEEGECFSLKVFCDLINNIGAEKVHIVDPHSDVTPALLNNCIIESQHDVFSQYFTEEYFPEIKRGYFLISPDAGALKKIYKLAAITNSKEVIECSKLRNTKTGAITATHVETHGGEFDGETCFIVDDICDGGRTFIEIAKILKEKSAGKIVLMVSHGFFTKGMQVFDGLIDEIYTRKGRVK